MTTNSSFSRSVRSVSAHSRASPSASTFRLDVRSLPRDAALWKEGLKRVRLEFVGSDRAIPRSPVGGKPTSERPSQPPSSKTLGGEQ
jgi:hypothetical protein